MIVPKIPQTSYLCFHLNYKLKMYKICNNHQTSISQNGITNIVNTKSYIHTEQYDPQCQFCLIDTIKTVTFIPGTFAKITSHMILMQQLQTQNNSGLSISNLECQQRSNVLSCQNN